MILEAAILSVKPGQAPAFEAAMAAPRPLRDYDIASRALSATELNQRARGHGGIENPLHGVLDMVMNEDQARARKDNAPENPALLRWLARNIIKRNADKGSNRLKLKRAGWEDRCLAKLISEIA